jgi:hypothetical protein
MKTLLIATIFGAGTLNAGSLRAETQALEPGEYEVRVRLELPHIEDVGASKMARVCVTGGDSEAHGLVVLSDNNPLAHCPVFNVRQNSSTLTFDIVCPGGNAATGSAKFTIRAQGFEGAIAMKMGGKNMTMTERQSGRHIGNCNATQSPYP